MTTLAPAVPDGEALLAYHRLRAALGRFDKPPQALSATERAAAARTAAREYALEQRVLASPEAAGAVVSQQAVESALATVVARYADAAEFEADLLANGLTETTLRAALRRQLRVEAAMEQVASRAADISELDVMLYYYLHHERLV
ncbi:MAG: nitrogen fixation protein NifM, partial [Gemmatimonadota bacterium]